MASFVPAPRRTCLIHGPKPGGDAPEIAWSLVMLGKLKQHHKTVHLIGIGSVPGYLIGSFWLFGARREARARSVAELASPPPADP